MLNIQLITKLQLIFQTYLFNFLNRSFLKNHSKKLDSFMNEKFPIMKYSNPNTKGEHILIIYQRFIASFYKIILVLYLLQKAGKGYV